MLKTRIIPILTFNGFALVKTKKFANPRMVGNPVQVAKVYNSREVDELVFLDIFATSQRRKINLKLVADIVKQCYMPVAIGGGIETLDDINLLLKAGADKVVIKTKALTEPNFIRDAVGFFGSQCICIAVDAYTTSDGYKIFNELELDLSLAEFIKKMSACDVGEFIITSVDNDGMMQGFDIELIKHSLTLTNIPVIASGGGGEMEHYKELFLQTQVQAVASASIFHFTQYTPFDIKKELNSINIPVRI